MTFEDIRDRVINDIYYSWDCLMQRYYKNKDNFLEELMYLKDVVDIAIGDIRKEGEK